MEPSSNKPRTAYPSDICDAEWDFCQPYLVLMKEDAPQRDYSPHEVFNALRYIVRCGCQWRMMPHDLPPLAERLPAGAALDKGVQLRSHGS